MKYLKCLYNQMNASVEAFKGYEHRRCNHLQWRSALAIRLIDTHLACRVVQELEDHVVRPAERSDVQGGAPVDVIDVHTGATLYALPKLSGGVRPIACGSVLRRLADACKMLGGVEIVFSGDLGESCSRRGAVEKLRVRDAPSDAARPSAKPTSIRGQPPSRRSNSARASASDMSRLDSRRGRDVPP